MGLTVKGRNERTEWKEKEAWKGEEQKQEQEVEMFSVSQGMTLQERLP